MTKQDAINKLMENGITKEAAVKEFNNIVCYYTRGTFGTIQDKQYAIKEAIEDIMSDYELEISSATESLRNSTLY